MVRIQLLGPVRAWRGGVALDLGGPKQQAVLAVLTTGAADGHATSRAELVDALWPEQPPASVENVIQTYLKHLRRVLEPDRPPRAPSRFLQRVPGGYTLNLSHVDVDLVAFRRLVDAAAEADRTGEAASAARRLREALGLWRGTPLANLDFLANQPFVTALSAERWAAVARYGEAQLAIGNAAEALPVLAEATTARPLDEGAHARLIRAYHAAGDRAQAFATYQIIRHRLAEELGVDPGHELTSAHEALLAEDRDRSEVHRSVVPRQLPAPPQLFTGRVAELADLDGVVDASTVVITAIDGMAGIGKTALAVHAAHRIAGHYPDGQLFIDLHGYTPGVKPIEPAEALDHALRALGIPGTQIPAGLDEKAGLYRSRLADQKILIVLDNAATEAQVAPLLPGSPGCLVLVTSRRRLAGLDHTHTLSLDTLPASDAVALFVQTARLTGESPELLTELVELCGRLPLAIRIAAARLRSRPAWTLSHLVARLRDRQHRLTELAAGPRTVTAALDLSYHDLGPDQQRAYRLLGQHPGPDIDAYATAALLDSTLEYSGRMLDQLIDAHLLLEPVVGRYRFHDLTRAHAAGVATRDRAASDRLLDYYRHTAAAAMDTAYPYERGRRPLIPTARGPIPELPDPASALGWLDTELPNLLATATDATGHDRPTYILDLSTTLQRHLQVRGRYRGAATLHQQALTTARAIGHRVGELTALTGLGYVELYQGQYEQAIDHYQQALQLARAAGHRVNELDALNGLGDIQRRLGRYEPATDHFRQALRLARAASDHVGELDALIGLGVLHLHQDQYEEATDHHQQALRLARATGDRPSERAALIGLGHVHRMQSRYEQATDHYQQALQLSRTIGHRPGQLTALTGLGDNHRLQGRYEQASDHYQQALQLARAIGHRLGEVNVLVSQGDVDRMHGRYEQAMDHYQEALQLARTIGYRPGEVDALVGLGHVDRRHGRHERATDHYRQLLALALETGGRNVELEARQGLGRVQCATGNPTAAIAHHERALALADELGQPDDQARAHDGLAHAHHALNQHQHARRHWQRALDLLTGLGVDQTEEEETTVAAIRARLATIDSYDSSGLTV